MKITRPQKNKKRILIFGIGLVAVALITVGILYWLKAAQDKNTGNGPTPQQQKEAQRVDNENKKTFAEETKDTDNPGVTVPTPSSPDTIELSASKSNASTVTVFTKLKNYASGECKLSVNNGSKNYHATAQIIYQPEYSMCAGFDVPVETLGIGNWTIKLEAIPTGGDAVTKTISLEVK